MRCQLLEQKGAAAAATAGAARSVSYVSSWNSTAAAAASPRARCWISNQLKLAATSSKFAGYASFYVALRDMHLIICHKR